MSCIYTNISECVTLEGAYQKNGRNIFESDLSIIKNAAIVVQNGRISWVGCSSEIPKKYLKLKKVSLKNKVVVPGFVECHTHSIFAGNRSYEFEQKCQGMTYAEIAQSGGGIVSTVKETRRASENELLKNFSIVCFNFLKQGVTTLEVKSGYGLSLKEELKILKVARKLKTLRVVTTYLGPHAKAPEYESSEEYFNQVLKDLKFVRKSGLADRVDIFIERNYFDETHAEAYFKKAKKLGFQIVSHTHQLNPSEGVKASVKYGALSCDHLNHINLDDIKNLAQSETTAVLIPTADFYLNLKYPPAKSLIDSGARVALTTDFNPGSSPTQDLAFVGLIARRYLGMTLAQVFSAWTVAPSFALSLEKQVGSISPGKYADFVVLKNSWRDLFYQVGVSQVESVYQNGCKAKLTQK